MNLRDFQSSPDQLEWEMPSWGHPLSQGVMPLFLGVNEKIHPIGTIFVFGRIQFMLSAAHNIEELLKHDPRFANINPRRGWDNSLDLTKGLSLYALHHKLVSHQQIDVTLLPIRKITIATPTDVVTATADFVEGLQTFTTPISFRFPSVGDSVFSVGYADFSSPTEGIDLDAIRNREFDWQNQYSHRLFVREGRVRDLFTQSFANGYLEGPCFSFEGEIRHGMSGGPIYNASGNICGLNSAGATNFFGEPLSLGSVLYPLLGQNLSFGGSIGMLKLNATHSILDMVNHGSITSDGSESEIAFTDNVSSGNTMVHPQVPTKDAMNTHDDFSAFQERSGASKLVGEYYTVRKAEPK